MQRRSVYISVFVKLCCLSVSAFGCYLDLGIALSRLYAGH
jgi:hypothetical protein